MYVALAQESNTGRLVEIDDMERRNGLYILGRPRMGKSWLIVNLVIQDIENGHGVFFIDPHGDGINELRARYHLPSKCLFLDPENENYSFGINLLACQHLENLKARNDTFTKTKGVFDKLWKNTFEERPWLQLVLQNTIYAFIENQGYTLAEFPMFFRDPQFRNYIVNK